jgi:Holliday junction DNA helicase RuvA
MIGKITGYVDYLGNDHAIIDVNGVGYEVHLSERVISSFPPIGKRVSVFTEMVVREDLLQIVGFLARVERSWYRLLISVQGVGSKAALKILGTVGVNSLCQAILSGDATVITATPGIGPKIAHRIVAELKDKASEIISESLLVKKTTFTDVSSEPKSERADANVENASNDSVAEGAFETKILDPKVHGEALSALKNLGYSPHESAQVVARILTSDEEVEDLSKLVKLALHQLAPRSY